jgi:predicted Zn-dependent protease
MKPARTFRGLLTGLLLMSPSSAALAQSAAPPVGYAPLANSDEGGLWMRDSQIEMGTQQSTLLVRDQALNNYLHRIVCKLAGAQCASIRIYLVDVPYFNASCYSNGMLHIWTGLLLRSENEAQLAFVLGHELTHYNKRHVLNNYQSRRDTGNAMAFLAIGFAVAGVGLRVDTRGAYDLTQLVALSALFSYSRDQEREADAGGFDLAVANGYDPRQGAIIWANAEAEDAANPRRRPYSWTDDHPTNKERLASMAKRADELSSQKQGISGEEEFRHVMLPFRSQWLEEELARGQFDESITLVQRLLRAEPQSSQLKYYLAEAYRRRNAKGDLRLALTEYQEAAADTAAPTSVYRGLGMVALKSGQRDIAAQAFRKYLELAPGADDRAMVQLYLSNAGAAQ